MKVSLIIPSHNAADKIGRCLASLRAIDMDYADYEVIFVDDGSTDGTFEVLERECAGAKNWHAERLPANSGSPSRPRNHGMALAKGEYVFFLDCDDELLSDTLRLHYHHAQATKADIVRGYLVADDGRVRKPMNRLEGWKDTLSREERIAAIISRQSTTNTSLIRTSFLRQNALRWPEGIRMGEDTLFLASVLTAATTIEYFDHPTFVYLKLPALTASSTQSYGACELRDHLRVWRDTQKLLARESVDYIRSRLQVGLQTALSAIIFRNRGDIDENLFRDFSAFIQKHWAVIGQFRYVARYKEILAALQSGDFAAFKSRTRPRLLIVGYDLKFIASAIPDLETHFEIRLDKWDGHERHDEKKSAELLEWAELIWCEWLLANAVWYTTNKRPHQRLIARMHRMELGREFGEKIKVENIDAVTAVSIHYFERLLERFPNIPRAKARLLPNYVKTTDFRRDFSEARLFTLGMIGILPARKALDKALDILARLRRHDARYRLEVFGHRPEELGWVATDKAEMAYFEKCRAFIAENDLKESVSFNGHSDIQTALAEKHVGFVLSTSDSIREFPGSESFHIAVADGFAGGGISLVLDWMGAEYIWPKEFILPSAEAIADRIFSFHGAPEAFHAASERGRRFVEERYGAEKFAAGVKGLFEEVS